MIADGDSITFYLDPEQFEVGPAYTVEITRGYAYDYDDFSSAAYTVGGSAAKFFTHQSTSSGHFTVPEQDRYSAEIYVESYATLRDVYPIEQDGLALTAMRVRNRKVNSLSQLYQSITPVWNGSDWNALGATRNNSALALDVLRNADFNFVFRHA